MSSPVKNAVDILTSYANKNEMIVNHPRTNNGAVLFAANTTFTNNRDTKMSVSIVLNDYRDSKNENPLIKRKSDFEFKIIKNDGSKYIYKKLECKEDQLENFASLAMAQVDQFTVNKVQNLNNGKPNLDEERKFSVDGYPILKEGETIKDYIKQQTKPAGIVINRNDKYQAFTTYTVAANGALALSDTKDYKTVRGALKLLDTNGYTEDGLLKTYEIPEGYYDDYYRDINQWVRAGWGKDGSSEFLVGDIDSGLVNLSGIITEFDPTYGARYFVDYSYTNEPDGRVYENRVEVDRSSIEFPHSASRNVYFHVMRQVELLRSGNLDYDEDTRTPKEIKDYHVERVKSIEESIKSSQERLQELSSSSSVTRNEYWENSQKEKIEKYKGMLASHKDSYKALSSEKSLER